MKAAWPERQPELRGAEEEQEQERAGGGAGGGESSWKDEGDGGRVLCLL